MSYFWGRVSAVACVAMVAAAGLAAIGPASAADKKKDPAPAADDAKPGADGKDHSGKDQSAWVKVCEKRSSRLMTRKNRRISV